jgi:hypothetical protein
MMSTAEEAHIEFDQRSRLAPDERVRCGARRSPRQSRARLEVQAGSCDERFEEYLRIDT